MTILKYPK